MVGSKQLLPFYIYVFTIKWKRWTQIRFKNTGYIKFINCIARLSPTFSMLCAASLFRFHWWTETLLPELVLLGPGFKSVSPDINSNNNVKIRTLFVVFFERWVTWTSKFCCVSNITKCVKYTNLYAPVQQINRH